MYLFIKYEKKKQLISAAGYTICAVRIDRDLLIESGVPLLHGGRRRTVRKMLEKIGC